MVTLGLNPRVAWRRHNCGAGWTIVSMGPCRRQMRPYKMSKYWIGSVPRSRERGIKPTMAPTRARR